VDAGDKDHRRSLFVLERTDLHLVISAMVIAEACYLAGKYLGPLVEAGFLDGPAGFDVPARRFPRTGRGFLTTRGTTLISIWAAQTHRSWSSRSGSTPTS
jgi:hypothetical protein